MMDTIGTGQDFATVILWEADIGVDVAVGAPRTGIMSVDEALDDALIINVSNANNAPHTLGAASGVRMDGSGAESGARMVNPTGHCITISTNHFTVQDLLIVAEATTKNAIIFTSGGSNTTVQRNACVQKATAGTERTITASSNTPNNDFFLNNIFNTDSGCLAVAVNVSDGGKFYCNTIVIDDAATANVPTIFKANQQDVRGNIVVAKLTPTGGEYNGVGAGGSTQNAGEDGTAATVGSADIDFTDDLSITFAEIVENRTLATINMLRKSANHGDMPITDVSASTGLVDVTGTTFDPTATAMVAGAHQIAMAVAAPPSGKEGLGFGLGVGLDAMQG